MISLYTHSMQCAITKFFIFISMATCSLCLFTTLRADLSHNRSQPQHREVTGMYLCCPAVLIVLLILYHMSANMSIWSYAIKRYMSLVVTGLYNQLPSTSDSVIIVEQPSNVTASLIFTCTNNGSFKILNLISTGYLS